MNEVLKLICPDVLNPEPADSFTPDPQYLASPQLMQSSRREAKEAKNNKKQEEIRKKLEEKRAEL